MVEVGVDRGEDPRPETISLKACFLLGTNPCIVQTVAVEGLQVETQVLIGAATEIELIFMVSNFYQHFGQKAINKQL